MRKNHPIIQTVVLLFVLSLLIVFAVGVFSQDKAYGIGDEVDDFEIEDLEGNIHRLSDHAGEVIILNFFATWCDSCEKEMPDLIEFQEEFQDDISYFTIVKSDSKRTVEKYIDRTGYDIPYYFDFDLSISDEFGVVGQPETIVIDKDGTIKNHYVGPVSRDVLALEVSELNN